MKRAVGLEDLAEVAPEVHASLRQLLAYPADVLEQLGLFFQVGHRHQSKLQAPTGTSPWCRRPWACGALPRMWRCCMAATHLARRGNRWGRIAGHVVTLSDMEILQHGELNLLLCALTGGAG